MTKSATKTKDATDENLFEKPKEASPSTDNAVAIVDHPSTELVPAQPSTADANLLAILQTYEKLAGNPNVTPDALGKLLDVQETWRKRNAEVAFEDAFAQMQADLPVVEKDGRIIVREKDNQGKRTGDVTQDTPYAKWETAWPAIRPILKKYGFGLRHRIETVWDGQPPERRVRVTAVLTGHGHVDDSSYFDLPADTTGSKNNNQAWASSVSYAKRHTGFAILGIVAKGEDDDARASGGPIMVGQPLSELEISQLIEFAFAAQCPEGKLVEFLNHKRPKGHPIAKKIGDLPRSRYDDVVDAIKLYEANRAKREAEQKDAAEKQGAR